MKKVYSYLCTVDDIRLGGKKQNIDPMWKVLNKEVDLGEPTSFLDHVYLGCTQRQCEISKNTVDNYRTMFESRISAGATENYHARKIFVFLRGPAIWKVMPRNVWNDIVSWQTRRLNNSAKYLLHASMTIVSKRKELKSVGELSKVSSQCYLKCLYLARIGRPDILWSVNKLARSITKWSKACDKRLNRLISYIHHTCEYKQYRYVGNTAKQCRLGLFQDSDFAGDLEGLKIYFGWYIVRFGNHIFVPISWMCKKQTSVSHSSTGNTTQNNDRTGRPVVNKSEACSPPHTIHKRKQSQRVINDLDNVDFIPSNVQSFPQEALLYVFEDNEAVIKMIIKGRSPTMRHVSRTHRVALDWLFDRINLDSKIQIKYIDTKHQLADILTKGNFTRDEWNHLLCLFNISHFSSTECSEVMSKRTQKDSGEERVTAKSKPMMNLVSRCSERTPVVLLSTASESREKTRYESQIPLSSWN